MTVTNGFDPQISPATKYNTNLFYRTFIRIGESLQPGLLLLCRLYFGWVFVSAGLGKLQNMDSFIATLEGYQIPAPAFSAYCAALIELLGGFCLMIGAVARFAAIPLIFVMLVAYGTAHVDSVKVLASDPGIFVSQSPFMPMVVALFVLAFGPGKYSVDAIFGGER